MRLWFTTVICIAVAGFGPGQSILAENDFLISIDYSLSDQSNPSVAVVPGGRMAVVWVDKRFVQPDIYCQLFESGNIPIGDNFIINNDAENAWQLEPGLSVDWYGNYYTVWQDYRNNEYPFGPDIYFQELDSVGLVGTNINITIEPPDSSHKSPAVASDGWGKSIVVWNDLRYRHWDIFAQAIDADGKLIGDNLRVNDDYGTEPQHEPDAALAPDGWFVVVWYDGRNGGDDIYLQKFDSSGNRIGGNIRVNDDDGSAQQKFPSVSIGGNGNIYVAWTDWRNGNYPENPDIYGQVYYSDLLRNGNNIRISKDGTGAAQRDARLAADRMGNACVVWSDSSGGDWNVTAQLIESSGRMKDFNFPVNENTTGRQLLPDVAMDGHYLYFVWADNRSGNYDIYGRVIGYNNPALIARPDKLDFTVGKNESSPSPALVYLGNAGYGEISYQLDTDCDWIILSRDSGTTPDSFYINLDAGELDYGHYSATIRLLDQTYFDSSSFLPVTLTVSGPLLAVQPDTLNFSALLEFGDPAPQDLTVTNDGTGILNWSLENTSEWLIADKTAGTEDEIISIACNLSGLSAGHYETCLVFSDNAALNSPESVQVILDVTAEKAYLYPEPKRIYHHLPPGEVVVDSILLENRGAGISQWQAAAGATWIYLENHNGSDNDYLHLEISAADLTAGCYSDVIRIEDDGAFNSPLEVPCSLAVYPKDTIFIPPLSLNPGESGQSQIYLNNQNKLGSGVLKFGYDISMIALDSLSLSGETIPGSLLDAQINSGEGCFMIYWVNDSTSIEPGSYFLGDIYLTANDSLAGITSFTIYSTDSFYLDAYGGIPLLPHLDHSGLEINMVTSADDRGRNNLPTYFSLGQNYPNPFNDRTAIEFNMARSCEVRIDVFNILGCHVASLFEGFLSAGRQVTYWDGRNGDGGTMASGIYFYKMITPEYSAVRKMVYLK